MNDPTTPTTIADLPLDVMAHVAVCAHPQDLPHLRATCKHARMCIGALSYDQLLRNRLALALIERHRRLVAASPPIMVYTQSPDGRLTMHVLPESDAIKRQRLLILERNAVRRSLDPGFDMNAVNLVLTSSHGTVIHLHLSTVRREREQVQRIMGLKHV